MGSSQKTEDGSLQHVVNEGEALKAEFCTSFHTLNVSQSLFVHTVMSRDEYR